MQEITVYDPPMCCSTGVCGAAPDPELAQVANNLNLLAKKGTMVKRYNLSQSPGAFAQQAEVMFTGRYPTELEWNAWISGIKEQHVKR